MPGQSPNRPPPRPTAAAEPVAPSALVASAETPIRVECPGGHVVFIKPKYAGRRGRCPVCKGPIDVPGEQRSDPQHHVQTIAGAASPHLQTLDWSPTPPEGEVQLEVEESTIAPKALGKIGRFELQELLGKGSFGTVYLAYDRQLKRDVALKVPRGGLLDNPEDQEKFLREARAAAHLRHANIVPVYEAGVDGQTHYIAMGYIKGTTIKARLDGGWRPSPGEAARIISKIASALHSAHLSGVIHRDVKPANVLLDAQNEPFVADFGLARREHAEAVHTIEGTMLGTPAYMSPEQARGDAHAADARADLWSVGVMFYELLAGQRPFRGSITEILKAIPDQEPPRPRTIDPTVPRDLETIALKCLAKHPDQRYASCQHLVEELQRWELGVPILARRAGLAERSAKWARRNPALATLSGALLGVTAVLLVSLSIFAVSLREQQKVLTKAAADSKASEQRANDNAARAQASEKQLNDVLAENGITTADKAQAIRDLQRAAQESAAKEKRIGDVTAERDAARDSVRTLTTRNEQLIADLEQASKVPEELTVEELVKQLVATGSEPAYRFGFKLAERYYLADDSEKAARLLATLPQEHRDWEWFHLRAKMTHPKLAATILPSLTENYGDWIDECHFHPTRTQLIVLSNNAKSLRITAYERQAKAGTVSFAGDVLPLNPDNLPTGRSIIGITEDGSHLYLRGTSKFRGAQSNCFVDTTTGRIESLPVDYQDVIAVFKNADKELVVVQFAGLRTGIDHGDLAFTVFPGNRRLGSFPIKGKISSTFFELKVLGVSSNGQRILTGSLALLSLNREATFDVHQLQVSNLRAGGIYKQWVFAVDDHGVHVWDANTGEMQRDLSAHTAWLGEAGCPLISPSGKRVILDNALCDVVTGEVLLTFPKSRFLGFAPKTGELFRVRVVIKTSIIEALLAPKDLSSVVPVTD